MNIEEIRNYFLSKNGATESTPFDDVTLDGKKKLSEIVKAHDPPFSKSKDVYDYIKSKLENWIEEAIKIRRMYEKRRL